MSLASLPSLGLLSSKNIFIKVFLSPFFSFPISYRHYTETSNQLPQSSPCQSYNSGPMQPCYMLTRPLDKRRRPLSQSRKSNIPGHDGRGRHPEDTLVVVQLIYSVFPLPLFFSLISPPNQITENKKNAMLVLMAPI